MLTSDPRAPSVSQLEDRIEEAMTLASVDSLEMVAVEMGLDMDLVRAMVASAQTMRLTAINAESGKAYGKLIYAINAQDPAVTRYDIVLNEVANKGKHAFVAAAESAAAAEPATSSVKKAAP